MFSAVENNATSEKVLNFDLLASFPENDRTTGQEQS